MSWFRKLGKDILWISVSSGLVALAALSDFIGVMTWLSGFIQGQIQIAGTPATVSSAGLVPWIIMALVTLIFALSITLIRRIGMGSREEVAGLSGATDRLRRFRRTVYNYIKRTEKPHKYSSLTWTFTCSSDTNDFVNMESLVEADELLVKTQRIGRVSTKSGDGPARFED